MNIRKIILKMVLKVLVSALALYLVFSKVDLETIWETLKNLKWVSLIVALVLFNISQWISTLRLKLVLKPLEININYSHNLLLYYKGMFYNLFLPGGIGGDGFKAYTLNKIFKIPVKKIVAGLLLDRLFGLIGIIFLICIIIPFCDVPSVQTRWKLFSLIVILIVYLIHFIFVSLFFKKHKEAFFHYSFLGIAVNLFQSFAAVFILLSLGLNNNFIEYIEVFFFSSIATIFPFTVGGIGTRELVFSFAPRFLSVEAHVGITLCLIFFLLSSSSAFIGGFIKVNVEPVTSTVPERENPCS